MMNTTQLEVVANDMVCILAALGLATASELAKSCNYQPQDVAEALAALESNKLAERVGNCWTLSDELDYRLADRNVKFRKPIDVSSLFYDQLDAMLSILNQLSYAQRWSPESMYGRALDKATRQTRTGREADLPMVLDDGLTGAEILACCIVPSEHRFGDQAYGCLCQYINAKE